MVSFLPLCWGRSSAVHHYWNNKDCDVHKLLMKPKSSAAEGTRQSSKRQWRGRSWGWRELKVELFPSGGGSLASKEVTLNLKVSGAGLINRC